MRPATLFLTMFSLFSVLTMAACGGNTEAPAEATTTTVDFGPGAAGSQGSGPAVVIQAPDLRPPTVTVTAPSAD